MRTRTWKGKETAREYLTRMVSTTFNDECWEWPFCKRRDSYGYFGKEKALAHRYAFNLRYGHLPEPCGLHRCDNPSCFNPAHIFEGTPRDNALDMCFKGRNANPPNCKPQQGTKHWHSKLTEDQVREIRKRYVRRTMGFRKLAEQYGVTVSSIHWIVKRWSWKHVD